ncbi:melanoma-associated antigen 11-like [Thomomys bottae]
MMPYSQRTHPSKCKRVPQAQREEVGLVGEQILQLEEASTSVLLPTIKEMSLHEVVKEDNEEDQESCNQPREDLHPQDDEALQMELQKEALSLIPFLLYKYWRSKLVSDNDIWKHISLGYRHHFPVILDKASLFMQVLYGIDIKEVDPIHHTRVLAISAGITYDGILSDVVGMPKTGLLIIVLCIIIMEGNYATEEAIWHGLKKMEVYPDRVHFLYGDPKKLLMGDFLWEQYLACRKVPGSDPILYEFMWGPRAYEETTKMKVLQHWAKFCKVDPRSFGSFYEEALLVERGLLLF